jgi:hypothetical protein
MMKGLVQANLEVVARWRGLETARGARATGRDYGEVFLHTLR